MQVLHEAINTVSSEGPSEFDLASVVSGRYCTRGSNLGFRRLGDFLEVSQVTKFHKKVYLLFS